MKNGRFVTGLTFSVNYLTKINTDYDGMVNNNEFSLKYLESLPKHVTTLEAFAIEKVEILRVTVSYSR